MADVILFPSDRRQRLYVEYLPAYRDGLLALVGKLLAATNDRAPDLASIMDKAGRMKLVAASNHLSAMDLGPAACSGAAPEQLDEIMKGLLLAGRDLVELAKDVIDLLCRQHDPVA